MRCPACNAEIVDEQAAFCPRCGASLGTSAGETTTRLEPETVEAKGSEEPTAAGPFPGPPPPADQGQSGANEGEGPAALVSDAIVALRRALVSGGWAHAARVAAFGFLALLAVGTLFTAAVKLAEPTFGSGESPLWILTRLVLFGLFSLGVPIEQGGASVAVVPMGALALVGWAIVWASQKVVATSSADTAASRAAEGAKVGVPFALMCLIAAIVFRIEDAIPLSADAGMALVLGGLWGALFGAVGGLRAPGGSAVPDLVAAEAKSQVVRDGVIAGGTMLSSAGALAAVALLVYLVVDLAAGGAADLEAGQTVLLVVVIGAFAPNLIAGVIGFSLGAPVSWGAIFGIGPNDKLSLFGWGAESPAAYAYLALLIPLAACVFGGYVAWRRLRGPARIPEVLTVAAATFAVALTVAVWLGNAQGTLGGEASFEIGPDALAVFFLAFAWAGAGGFLGWKVGEAPISPPSPESVGASDPGGD